jgi:hypothetical protein
LFQKSELANKIRAFELFDLALEFNSVERRRERAIAAVKHVDETTDKKIHPHNEKPVINWSTEKRKEKKTCESCLLLAPLPS